MSLSVTALQLVNRVHGRRRIAAVTSFGEEEDTATLNALNTAKDELFSENRWEFNVRNNGQLTLKPYREGVTVSSVAGSTAVQIDAAAADLVQADVTGGYVTRLVPSGHTESADTAFRLSYAGNVTASAQVFGVTSTSIPAGTSSVSSRLFYSEYILPETVDSVIRATYQQDPLTLEQADPKIEYAELFPRPQIEYGSPEVVAVGGFDYPTYNNSSSGHEVGLRFAVWPVPDDEYVVDYSYYYRHPDLEDETSTLVGVPPNIVSRIVDMAAADMKVFYERDYDAVSLRNSLDRRSQRANSVHGGSKSARKRLNNWGDGESGGRRYYHDRIITES